MTCEAHIIAWNRQDTIQLTIRHYQQFCERVVIYDNFSDDLTREIALELGADVRLFGTKGVLSDQDYLDVKNNCWRASKADWVIVCDDDEILTVLDDVPVEHVLLDAKIQGHTIFKGQGYCLYSEDMPQTSWLDINAGFKDEKYSKMVCFNPRAVESINYVFGCHEANPKGNLIYNTDLSLLHYHAVGGAQRMIDRHALYEERRQRSPINMRWQLGAEYGHSAESKRIWFREQLSKSKTLF